ncbi:hypothetical protein GCM10010994_59500 [Chelatococcus reniformis]|uniref:Uncharacterized protein n=1 Tax=Chelatococcus reniformis TaxID=1494448 RepID=A0A916XQ02_9HYPH|nr:hypothetical protein GCM10010994_59500 [Chelatococcus reniformis]
MSWRSASDAAHPRALGSRIKGARGFDMNGQGRVARAVLEHARAVDDGRNADEVRQPMLHAGGGAKVELENAIRAQPLKRRPARP